MINDIHIWVSLAIVVLAMILYASERLAMEVSSLLILVLLLIFFSLMPLVNESGVLLFAPQDILAGFGNPALLTIMALLVIAQGMFQSGAFDKPIDYINKLAVGSTLLAVVVVVVAAAIASAFLNNTPVVLLAIPILIAVAARQKISSSPMLMGLNYMVVLGGNLTLLGSSTNLLVADSAARIGAPPFKFFTPTLLGLLLLCVGGLYVFFIMPRLLRRNPYSEQQETPESGRQYIMEIRLRPDSPLVGANTQAGFLPALHGMTLQMIERGTSQMLPPFDDYTLRVGDKLFIAATRQEIADALADKNHPLHTQILPLVPTTDSGDDKGDMVLAELVVAPGSRMAGRGVYQTGFIHLTDCFILGVQRRSHMVRQMLGEIRLEEGDILLVIGQQSNIDGLPNQTDALLMQWSARELPQLKNANRARLIFGATVLISATGTLPIVVASLAGACAMVASGVLNVRQAVRGFDLRIFLVIAAALGMANALFITGGATLITTGFLTAMEGASPAIILSAFFLICAVVTNILSNNATALLFTPLALGLAQSLDVPPMAFLLAVIFAANSGFATPIAYQTNLLVMTPGNFRFADFMKAGIPLIIIIWLTYSFVAPLYFGF
ncbi:MAG: SLC13 family permease [Alphaproteobacteria bacterium]|nr:SLC13 family permease [Alphaproteobacteria bacterium]